MTPPPPPPPSHPPSSGMLSAHAPRCSRSAVSACSAAARSFSPLCFTDSGFNSDSTQYPADCAAPKQVSSFQWTRPRHVSVLSGSISGLRSRFEPPPPHFSHVSFRLGIRVVLCVYVVVCVYGGAGPCSCTPGDGGVSFFFFFLRGEKCIVKKKACLEITGMHTRLAAPERRLR